MWTPNRNNGNIEYVGSKEIDIKVMLVNVINNTIIDYNRGFNNLWDIGLDDSKDKKYYVFNKPIVKPNFINVAFILERIILKNNNWEIDEVNVFPAIGGYCGCQNIDLQFEYTNKDIWDKSIKELAEVARELGYEPVKGCPISFTQEVLFRKIGTWNKPYIMRSRRSKYFKKKWNYLSKERIKGLVDCFKSKKFKETPYIRKKDDIKRSAWSSKHLSEKMPKYLIEELNYWFDVLKKYEWIWDPRHSDDDDEDIYEIEKRVKQFMKNSKLGLRTLWRNADRLYPVYENGCQSVENMIMKYNIAWKMYDRVASSWCRDYDGHYHNIMGIGPEHADDQGNYYL
jgi:hypothetical protein